MNEIKVSYNIISQKDQIKRDRIQLLTASFAFFIGYLEIWDSFMGLLLIIPIAAFLIALINIALVIGYNWFVKKLSNQFETALFILNGIMMLITGLTFQLIGTHNVQYVYYLLAVFYMLFIPLINNKLRLRMLQFLPKEIIAVRWIRKPKEYNWNNIESIIRKDELLKIKEKDKRKQNKYFLIFNNQNAQSRLDEALRMKQRDYNFSLELL